VINYALLITFSVIEVKILGALLIVSY